ncbi:hypothetical protein LWX53_03315 [bacterium]|nr:hypothetical protein [bacterium]
MKNRTVAFAALAVTALFLSLSPAFAGTSDAAAAAQGIRTDISGGARFAPSYDAYTNILPAWGFDTTVGIEYAMSHWIPLRAELGVFSIGSSAWDASLFRFRAFWGYRLAALTGARLSLGRGELDILVGGAVSASRFTGLNQVTAFASAVGELRYKAPVTLPFFGGLAFDAIAAVPIEYLYRGTARTISVGLDLGVVIKLARGGAK